jgi:hypothetical protein
LQARSCFLHLRNQSNLHMTLYGIAYNIRQCSRLTVHGDVLLEPLWIRRGYCFGVHQAI